VFERYREAVDYLQRRLWHELPIMPVERALQSRIRTLLAHFGDPHRAVPVVHVGGSAGKGSTATMIAAILRAAGLRTGLYTSPHLQTFIERIDVDGQLIAPDRFADLVLGLDPLVRKMHVDVLDGVGFGRPSLVEVAFAVGMKHFADEQCDVAVIEVGLGGRTDCTNVFDDPIPSATVLTNVGLEHVERLGPRIVDIAREKSQIIKGGPVVVGAGVGREALRVIEQRCDERSATLFRSHRNMTATLLDARGSSQAIERVELPPPLFMVDDVRLPIPGAHQAGNAALAAASAVLARPDAITADAIRCGLGAVRINARLETMQTNPRVILDGAHNPAEARATAQAIRDHFFEPKQPLVRGAQPPPAVNTPKLHLIAGILADKDQRSMARALAPIADTVTVTQPPLAERTGGPDRMLAVFREHLLPEAVAYEPSPDRALDLALSRASSDDIVLATGSMFLAGALRERWVPEQQILEHRSSVLSEPPSHD
jgi:dihydrofolate synthase/folylpolyglutamate synthase